MPLAPVVVHVEGIREALASVVEARLTAAAQEVAALRAEVAALREQSAHLTTRVNSLQGLVNRKLTGPEPPPPTSNGHALVAHHDTAGARPW